MADKWKQFSDKNLVIIFTYAPAGLGHLRVTDALLHGLPKRMEPLLLGSMDELVTYMHRITSIHPVLRRFMEWVQRGKPEDLFTNVYRWWLRQQTRTTEEQLATIVEQRVHKPRTVLVVSTHFGLAHQIAEIKDDFAVEHGINMKLVVQVTDDSPQQMWYVKGANLTVVPSYATKKALHKYGKRWGKIEEMAVCSYPVSGKLNRKLKTSEWKKRKAMLESEAKERIMVMIPISGAAVGLKYFEELVEEMEGLNGRYRFVVVSRLKMQTQGFIGEMLKNKRVEVVVGGSDREVVDKYEEEYMKRVVGIELTKPSEQAFKALIEPKKRGGSVLLFSKPVGRQEYDNLDFLERHGLIPDKKMQDRMWRMAKEGKEINKTECECACGWRGLRLPEGIKEGAKFIEWCLQNGVLQKMLECEVRARKEDAHKDEMRGDGVEQFWNEVVKVLLEK